MIFYDLLWPSMTFYGLLWPSMTFYELLWPSSSFHNHLLTSMTFNTLLQRSRLSLTSSCLPSSLGFIATAAHTTVPMDSATELMRGEGRMEIGGATPLHQNSEPSLVVLFGSTNGWRLVETLTISSISCLKPSFHSKFSGKKIMPRQSFFCILLQFFTCLLVLQY